MTLELFIFYVLAIVTVASGVMVISARNAVHSVLFLILAFFNVAGLFVLIGAEFLAMILVIVYVGAVAVLFMFVVMMLDVNFIRLRQGAMQYLPIGLLVGVILLVELVLVGGTWAVRDTPVVVVPPAADAAVVVVPPAVDQAVVVVPPAVDQAAVVAPMAGALPGMTNTEAIGNLLYTNYFFLFQAAGLILLVAIIGAISLTLRQRPVRRQDIGRQVHRSRLETIEIRKVRSGSGI